MLQQQNNQFVENEKIDNRTALRTRFVEDSIWATWKNTPLTADASFRRYFRLTNGQQSVLLMDSPPDTEDIDSYVKIDQWLLSTGLRAPQIFKLDVNAGFAIIEDFGQQTYTYLLDKGLPAEPLYKLAVDVLTTLHTFDANNTPNVPQYTEGFYQDEAALFIDWYWPARTGHKISVALRSEFMGIWQTLLANLSPEQSTLVLRDYHVDNLMLVNDTQGINSCGLLDFQDALIGSKAYDLVSLLEDARREVDAQMAEDLIERYLSDFSAIEKEQFMYDYRVLGAHRHVKVIGIFVRLFVRDNKQHYLSYLPHVQNLLENSLKNPVLKPLATWLDKHHPGAITAPLNVKHSDHIVSICH